MAEKILHGPKMKSLVEMTSLGEFFFKHAEKYRDNICQVNIQKLLIVFDVFFFFFELFRSMQTSTSRRRIPA
jgi:hypothetical protein